MSIGFVKFRRMLNIKSQSLNKFYRNEMYGVRPRRENNLIFSAADRRMMLMNVGDFELLFKLFALNKHVTHTWQKDANTFNFTEQNIISTVVINFAQFYSSARVSSFVGGGYPLFQTGAVTFKTLTGSFVQNRENGGRQPDVYIGVDAGATASSIHRQFVDKRSEIHEHIRDHLFLIKLQNMFH